MIPHTPTPTILDKINACTNLVDILDITKDVDDYQNALIALSRAGKLSPQRGMELFIETDQVMQAKVKQIQKSILN